MKQNVEKVVLDILVKNNKMKTKILLFGILSIMILGSFVSCKSVKPEPLSEDARLRASYYFVEGVKKELASKHDEAFELFKHCLSINPDASEALYQLGLYHLALREDEQGEKYLNRAVVLEPDNIYYKESLASYYLKIRNFDKAIPVVEDIVRCNPARIDALTQLVSLYMDRSDYRKAIDVLNRIERIEGRSASISMEKFKLYRELNEEEHAFAELDTLAAENPNDLSYKVLIGDQYLLVQKPEKAYAIYKEVADQEPDNQPLQLSMLDYYKQTGQDSAYTALLDTLLYGNRIENRLKVLLMRNLVVEKENAKADSSEVLGIFERVLKNTDENVDMLALYASYMQLKKMDESRIAGVMEQILAIEPDNQAALLEVMRYALIRQDYKKVAEVCRNGLEHYPDQLPFYFYLGLSYYQLDQNEEALEAFKKGVGQINENSDLSMASDLYSILGDLWYKEGEKELAYAAYDSSLTYKSDNIGCLNNYAYYLSLDNKDLDKAEEMSYKTIKAEPSNKTYLDTYAWILFMKARYTEAKVYIDKVVQGDNVMNDAEVSAGVLEHAGDIYYKCGDTDQAMKYWEMAQKKGGDVTKVLKKKIQQKKYIAE